MFVILSWLISSNHQANEYGQLTIIDRKSNLVKIQSSYYVILAKVNHDNFDTLQRYISML